MHGARILASIITQLEHHDNCGEGTIYMKQSLFFLMLIINNFSLYASQNQYPNQLFGMPASQQSHSQPSTSNSDCIVDDALRTLLFLATHPQQAAQSYSSQTANRTNSTFYEYDLRTQTTTPQSHPTSSSQSIIPSREKSMKTLSMYLKTLREIRKDIITPVPTRLKAEKISNEISTLFVNEVEKEIVFFNSSSNQNSQ